MTIEYRALKLVFQYPAWPLSLARVPRAQLMAEIRRFIQTRKLAQNSAAKLFGVTQPRISALARGKIDLVSIETLVDMPARASIRVQLRLAPVRRTPRHPAA